MKRLFGVIMDILAGIPSIVMGIFGFTLILFLHRLGFAGASPGILLAGGCLFLCSDGILSFETFRDGDSNAADVAVMLTYIAAQTLLAIGFSMG